jgi:glutamyl-tRNA synthetase
MARHGSGSLLLRIEDTDRERSTPENVEQILDALRWLELDWDEGPISQAERAPHHRAALERLLESGAAYRDRATAEDVRAWKQRHGAGRGYRGEPSGYAIIVTAEDLAAAVGPYREQIFAMWRRLRALLDPHELRALHGQLDLGDASDGND